MKRFRVMSPALPFRLKARAMSLNGRTVSVENRRGCAVYRSGRLTARKHDRIIYRIQGRKEVADDVCERR